MIFVMILLVVTFFWILWIYCHIVIANILIFSKLSSIDNALLLVLVFVVHDLFLLFVPASFPLTSNKLRFIYLFIFCDIGALIEIFAVDFRWFINLKSVLESIIVKRIILAKRWGISTLAILDLSVGMLFVHKQFQMRNCNSYNWELGLTQPYNAGL
jgi:hypothetical protein